MKQVFYLMLLSIVLFGVSVFAQSYDLKFVLVNDENTVGGNYDIKIQIKASSAFNLGTSNLTFSYNASALQNPTLLTAYNFNDGNYDPITVTEPINGVTSVNIVLNAQENGQSVSTTYMDVATIRYEITDASADKSFEWRTETPNRTNVWNDDATPQETSAGTLHNYSATLANLKIFLEGPYDATSDLMNTTLRDNNYLPLSQPYNTAPWNYNGTESVSSIPADVVDWVLIELRTGTEASTKVSTRAAFVKKDGTVVDLDGTSGVKFEDVSSGDYYVVVRHRNHLDIMTASAITLNSNSALYDFTSGTDKVYGGSAKQLESGVYGMYAGDADGNGQVQTSDKNDYWWPQSGTAGYKSGDFDLNGQVQTSDKNDYWWNNSGVGSAVPE